MAVGGGERVRGDAGETEDTAGRERGPQAVEWERPELCALLRGRGGDGAGPQEPEGGRPAGGSRAPSGEQKTSS